MTRAEVYAAARDAGRQQAKSWDKTTPLENHLNAQWDSVMWGLVDCGADLGDARDAYQQFFVGAWQIVGVQ